MSSKLLGEKEVAAILGVAEQTLRNWRCQGKPPVYVKIGGRAIRYRREDIDSFIMQGRIDRVEA
jgi:predicted DNA-binding transcriptional regulator AlpA